MRENERKMMDDFIRRRIPNIRGMKLNESYIFESFARYYPIWCLTNRIIVEPRPDIIGYLKGIRPDIRFYKSTYNVIGDIFHDVAEELRLA